nr:hypothetical protein [Tanacetum cinerariifolium]
LVPGPDTGDESPGRQAAGELAHYGERHRRVHFRSGRQRRVHDPAPRARAHGLATQAEKPTDAVRRNGQHGGQDARQGESFRRAQLPLVLPGCGVRDRRLLWFLDVVTPLLLTRVEAAYAGRAYAAYGGIYIITSVAWLSIIERVRPLTSDWIGVAFCVIGATIILLGPRWAAT